MKHSTIILSSLFFVLGIILAAGVYLKNNALHQLPILGASLSPTPFPSTAFSLETAPQKAIRGVIVSQSGKIEWQSRTATEPAQLLWLIPIEQGETLFTGENSTIDISFASTDTVQLVAQSTVDIIQTLPGNLVFVQKKGSVSYTAHDPLPVSVRSMHLLTRINEGSLTITLPEDSSMVLVRVKEGKATVAYNDADYVSQVISLQEQQLFTFDDTSRTRTIEPSL